ncbi:hypothetical protein EV175_004766 [Coemansia sp. RSA 1933]|nr:hypothetical protein EV175_004766 [Coemansia sp. RSA 1933]
MRRSDDHSESAAVDSSEAAQPSRPPDMGVAGAWEVVEEPSLLSNHTSIAQEDSCSKTIDRSADGPNDQDMRGAEWLDDEDRDHDHALTDFKITEKKLGHTSLDPHTAATPHNADHPKDGGSGDRVVAAKDLFKKRRVASNRASSRNQRKKT